MANFFYKAVDPTKKIITGNISAKTEEEAQAIIAKDGLTALVIKTQDDKMLIKGTVNPVEKITFCRYLSIMLSTGLSLSEGLEVLRRETKDPVMNKVLADMSYNLEQGQQLSAIFERYPDVFEPYFLTLTRAGEVSGKLADIFRYLETELRAEHSLNSKVKGALLYPAIIFIAMIAIGILMFFFVLPQIGRVFLSLSMPLPTFTRLMFTFAVSLNQYVIPIVISGLGLAGFAVYAFRNQKMRKKMFGLIRPIPIIRRLIQKIDLARFSRIFATLLRSAVPITEALEISFNSLASDEYRKYAVSFPEEIKKGKTLSATFKETNAFPSLLVQMVTAGEKTATLDSTLSDLASFYEQEIEEEVKSLTQIIEPVLMLFVGIAVGGMILSIIAPIYSVVGSFQQAAAGPGGM